jgi:protein TonB
LLCDHTSIIQLIKRGNTMKKIISVLSIASVTTFGLFAFMASLINSDQVVITQGLLPVIVDIVELPEETKPEVIPRKQFQPPQPPPVMEISKVTPEISEVSPEFSYNPSELTVKSNVIDIVNINNQRDSEARPIVRVNPKYPMEAHRSGIQGWVILAFDISKIGEVINIKVIDSEPKRVFDKAARQALRKWKYRAKSVDGKQIHQKNFTVQLDFNMEQQI